MVKKVDCRGLACPQPVLETKKALESAEELIVLVDNPSSKENVRRFAESQRHRVSVQEAEGAFELRITKGKKDDKLTPEPGGSKNVPNSSSREILVFIDSDSLGKGSEDLGKMLMRSFLHTLLQSDLLPQKMIFMNIGVKLACQEADVVDDLRELGAKGVEILACGTCLDFFGLKKKLSVGKVSNMDEILSSLFQAGKLIKV